MKLIGKFVSRTSAAAPLGASTLDHEVRNRPMKNQAIVKGFAGFGSVGQADKVLNRLGGLAGEQLDLEGSLGRIEEGECFVWHRQ